MSEYGDRLETPTIIGISIFIVSCIVAVVWLNMAVHRNQCVPSYTTYCGDSHSAHDSGDSTSEH